MSKGVAQPDEHCLCSTSAVIQYSKSSNSNFTYAVNLIRNMPLSFSTKDGTETVPKRPRNRNTIKRPLYHHRLSSNAQAQSVTSNALRQGRSKKIPYCAAGLQSCWHGQACGREMSRHPRGLTKVRLCCIVRLWKTTAVKESTHQILRFRRFISPIFLFRQKISKKSCDGVR